MADYPTAWEVMSNYIAGSIRYQAWRQTRALRPGEPMNGAVMQSRGVFHTREEAQAYADQLNGGA